MKLAIMQPYFFPYIGYFQLVNAVDKFVFYDDVNFIKNGWINRNRILINGNAHYFTVNLKSASPNKLINEVEIIENKGKLKKTIANTYRRAPQFDEVWPLIDEVLSLETDKIGKLSAYSVIQTCNFLGIKTQFEYSSEKYSETGNLRQAERLLTICKINKTSEYINPIGGMDLYSKEDFSKKGINISFLKTQLIEYQQTTNIFINNLSIIDVMMFNPVEEIHKMLDHFELI